MREQSGLCIFIKWQLAVQSVQMRFCSSEEKKLSLWLQRPPTKRTAIGLGIFPKNKNKKKPKAKQKTVLTSFWIYSFVIASMEDLSPHWCPKCVLCLFDTLFNWLRFDIELDDSFKAVVIYIFASTMEKWLHEIWNFQKWQTNRELIITPMQWAVESKRRRSQRNTRLKASTYKEIWCTIFS